MWFTRVAIGNPVMAVMVMLAFVVLGLFSYQRLKVDQFPDIDFPTVVVQIDYPGASPEIVENEVTRKVEEAINTIAGINQLFSRSYEGSSVVIVQFNLDMDGRKAADDVREKVAADAPAAARRGQGRARLALRPGQPADLHAGADLARRLAQPAGADHLRRPGGAQAPGERARRRLGHAGRRAQARDQHLPATGGDGRDGHRRRAGAGRGARREPGTARRHAAHDRHREGAEDRRAHQAARGLRARSSSRARAARRCAWGSWPTWSTARRSSRTWRCSTASARWCWTCASRRARTPSTWSTA